MMTMMMTVGWVCVEANQQVCRVSVPVSATNFFSSSQLMIMSQMCNPHLKSLWSKPATRLKSSPAACPPKVAHQVHVLIMVLMMMMLLMIDMTRKVITVM